MLASVSMGADFKFNDVSGLMPDFDSVVTYRDVDETSLIIRACENWHLSKFLSYVRIHDFNLTVLDN
jgi:hypothetical protein